MTQNDSLKHTHSMYWPLAAQTSKPSQVALSQCLGTYNQQIMMMNCDSKMILSWIKELLQLLKLRMYFSPTLSSRVPNAHPPTKCKRVYICVVHTYIEYPCCCPCFIRSWSINVNIPAWNFLHSLALYESLKGKEIYIKNIYLYFSY